MPAPWSGRGRTTRCGSGLQNTHREFRSSFVSRNTREALLASIPAPKTLVAHLDQFVIGQNIAKRRLALGVSNHFKRLVDRWDEDSPDPIVADPDLHNVRIEKSNILLIGP